MSGGHWEYLGFKIEERIGAPLNDVWRLLAAIEHELDYGICGDSCYECAKIRTVNALETYFDTGATSVDNSLRLLRSSEPECERCKAWKIHHGTTRKPEPPETATVEFLHEGKMYKGVVYAVELGKEL